MLTIRQVYNEWKITYSNPGSGQRGYSVMARNLDEVHVFIDHHHARPHIQSKCPTCREAADNQSKANCRRRKL